MIAGTGSGCGKTTVTLAILRAMQRRGIPLAAFKCGPDYIDPMFYKAVLGIPSRNLDLFFINEREIRSQIVRNIPKDGLGVIEGVMGFYDGVSGTTDTASAAHLARATETPAVLVVRPKGQSLSLAAMLAGFRDFAENTLCGVILNGVPDGMYPFYRDIVKKSGLKVLGYLPPVPEAEIPDRHLGLVTADELNDLNYRLDLLADAAISRIEIDELLSIAHSAPKLADDAEKIKTVTKAPVRIAVARDKAFCFYYEDNFNVLRDLGAELVEFSPISDSCLPENIDGLYLGGGYPELYAKALSNNENMRNSIKNAINMGIPTIAECGGFLYLHEHLDGVQMAGVVRANAVMTKKLQPFGYVTLTAQKDNVLSAAQGQIRAHEFHYAKSEDNGANFIAEKPNGRRWQCVHATQSLYAGFPHLFFRANIEFAEKFVRQCVTWRKNVK